MAELGWAGRGTYIKPNLTTDIITGTIANMGITANKAPMANKMTNRWAGKSIS